MAVSLESSGGGPGKRKNINSELNLVPFVDLLSVCICFLLMTAVWMQIGSMQVKQAFGTDAEENKMGLDLAVQFQGATDLQLEFKQGNKVVFTSKVSAPSKEALSAEFGKALEQSLSKMSSDPANAPFVSSVMVKPHQDASYGHMASVLDSLRKHQIVNIAILPGAA